MLKKIGFLLVFLIVLVIGWSLGAFLIIMPFVDLTKNKPIVFTEAGREEKYGLPCPAVLKIKSFDTEWYITETRELPDLQSTSINTECNNYEFFP